MQEYAQASMVSEADLHGGLSTTISRTAVEEALRLDEPPALVLDITGPSGERSIAVSWKRDDLERLLGQASGDTIQLTFDRAALEHYFAEDDVDAHGLKQKAAVLAVALAAAAGVAGGASAMPMGTGGGPSAGQADPTDGGIVNPSTGMRIVNQEPATGGDSVISEIAPGAAALGGAAIVIAGAAFAFGAAGQRRRPAAT
ncbi:MAG TPA: hypothetical protein VFU10_04120 [Gaiellaceae bacterium]|nr:hypothetical protein [Gaiellaceae bacterium]